LLASRSAGAEEDGGEGPATPPWQWVVRAPPPYNTSHAYTKSAISGSWKGVKGYREEEGVRRPIEFKAFALRDGAVTGAGEDPVGKFALAGTYRVAHGARPGDPSEGDSVLFYQEYLGQHWIRYSGLVGRLDKARDSDRDRYYVEGNWYREWSRGTATGDFYLALDK
jgi:hypothetical protein